MAVGWAREGDTEKETENAIAMEIYRARKSLAGPPRTECIDCDEPIGEARLRVHPTAQRCIRCQAARE